MHLQKRHVNNIKLLNYRILNYNRNCPAFMKTGQCIIDWGLDAYRGLEQRDATLDKVGKVFPLQQTALQQCQVNYLFHFGIL